MSNASKHASREALKERVQFSTQLLEQYKARADELNAEVARAEAVLLAARTELIISTTARDDLLAQQTALEEDHQRLLVSLAAVPPWVLEAVPGDVLREIFTNVVAQSGSWAADSTWIDCKPRMRAPFHLAAICKRWRAVAVDAPPLWSFVCPPMLSETARHGRKLTEAARECVRLLLQRSKSSPLDVVYIATDDSVNFDAIVAHCERWRSFTMRVEYYYTSTLSVFRRPTPQLERFALRALTYDSEGRIAYKEPYPRYLPFAPRLRTLESALPNFLVAGPRAPMHGLTDMQLTTTCTPLRAVLDALRSTLHLERLRLSIRNSEYHESESTKSLQPVQLDRLRVWACVLTPDVRHCMTLILAPALQSLHIDARLLVPDCLSAVAGSLITLVVDGGDVGLDALPALKTLEKVEELTLTNFARFTDAFLNALAADRSCLPHLRQISMHGNSSIVPADGDGLGRLIATRIGESDGHAAAASSRLIAVSLVSPDLPDWLKAQVHHMLSSPN